MVIKHRTNSSLGNHLDLVERMVSRWGSMTEDQLEAAGGLDAGDVGTDSDYDDADPSKPKGHGQHRRKKSAQDEMRGMKA